MNEQKEQQNDFVIIGENIHATRVVKRSGVRGHVFDNGLEAVKYKVHDEIRYLRVPDHFTETQPYQQGNLKHFMIAVWKGVNGNSNDIDEAVEYIRYEILRQEKSGANYLDLNVDEASYNLDEQKTYMKWLVQSVEKISTIPISIDSSNPDIIEAGLSVYNAKQGRALLNSVALERIETLSLAIEHNARVIVSAASESGMPNSASERLENVAKIVDISLSKGIEPNDIFIDPLIFPIAVDPTYGVHVLDSIRMIRQKYGADLHITGGMSNISFGLPKRKLVNDVFVRMAIEAGIDSGIVDPTQTNIEDVMLIDMELHWAKLVKNLLLGNDEFATSYISAFRSGELEL